MTTAGWSEPGDGNRSAGVGGLALRADLVAVDLAEMEDCMPSGEVSERGN